jgi:hypothetical protein
MSLDVNAILAWLKQPSTVTGLSALAAAAVGALSGQMTWAAAVPGFVFGAVAIVLPDNSSAWADARKLVTDALAANRNPTADALSSPVLQDMAALAADVQGSIPVSKPRA